MLAKIWSEAWSFKSSFRDSRTQKAGVSKVKDKGFLKVMQGSKLFTKEEIREFQIRRSVTSLYKTFLIILEDLREENLDHFDKLYKAFPEKEDIIRQADYFTEERLSYLRKKVLDAGNDCIRNITGENNG